MMMRGICGQRQEISGSSLVGTKSIILAIFWCHGRNEGDRLNFYRDIMVKRRHDEASVTVTVATVHRGTVDWHGIHTTLDSNVILELQGLLYKLKKLLNQVPMEIKKPTRQLWGSNPKGWDFVRVSPLRRGSSEGLTAALTRRFYFALIDHDSLFTGWSMPCGAVHMVPDPICNIGIASGTTAYVWVMDLGGTLPIKPISECLLHCSDERPVHGHLT